MTTLMLLLARYDGKSSVPFEKVAHDFFSMESKALFNRFKGGKIDPEGEKLQDLKRHGIPLPWLAKFIDDRREEAHERMDDWCD